MNPIDKLVEYFNPAAALRRHAARSALAYYEAAEPSRMRKLYKQRGSPNEAVQRGAIAVRTQARHLVKNHDLARGALRVLVNNVVGPNGIGIEPQPRRIDGTIHTEYAAELLEAYRDWCRYPEVTHRLPWPRLQRAFARAWLRDGEVFGQMITGTRPDLNHGTLVPFSIEAFEADIVPMDLNDTAKNIVQGIERNTWGQPLAIHVLKTDPTSISLPTTGSTKRIPWDRSLHLATLDHIGQVRGVSEFASVITRLEDIKDYEESERVAAKIAAMLTAYVKKGQPDLYEANADAEPRQLNLQPGMIIDDLAPGEDIGMINSNRPNPNLITFRQGQLRAIASGLGGSYSSISKDYNGTYSAQRQELVEQWIHYAILCDEFTGEICKPVWEQFVEAAHLSGVVKKPKDLKPGTQASAMYTAQAMPWIDPLKEANAWATLVENGFASEVEAIRRRGGNPHDVLDQIASFRKKADELGVTLKSAITPEPVTPEETPAQTAALLRDTLREQITAGHAALGSRIEAMQASASAAPGPVINVAAPNVEVNMPAQAGPVVNLSPVMHAPAVDVHNAIHVPEQAAPVVNYAAPEIHNEITVQPAAVSVELPTRKTETTIERDASGNISKATQVETTVEDDSE